ncbi:DUF2232 domain-containing protein [Candidatus Poribacteria bacterium]|nr:DUF2232 domain-containing protein [Candidatus Poribacteria bacterium]
MVSNTKSIIEGAFLVSIAVILYVLGIYNIALGFIATIFCPVPIILLILRYDNKIVFTGFIVSILLLSSLAGILESVTFAFEFLLPGYVMGYLIKKNASPEKVVILTGIASVLATFLFIIISAKILQKDLMGDILNKIETSGNEVIEFYKSKGISDIALLKDQLEYNVKIFKRIFPGLFIFASFFAIIINYEITKKIITRLGHSIQPINMINMKVPDNFIWGFIAAFIFRFIKLETILPAEATAVLYFILENILFLFVILYFFQGIVICMLYMKKWKFPKFFLYTNLILFFLSSMSLLPLLLGIFDFWFDFKTKLMKTSETQ